jgi:hypothetical protein
MMEFSVLWAVFPVIDQLLRGRFDYWIVLLGFVFAVLSFGVGLLLAEGDH